MFIRSAAAFAALALASVAFAQTPAREPQRHFTAADVFNLEYANDPQIAPNGRRVAYVRRSADIMTDRFRRSIWLVDESGADHRPLAQGAGEYSQPVWSPRGEAIAYTASESGAHYLRVYYLDTNRAATLARLPAGARNLTWSPDGATLAFQMFVEETAAQPAGMPHKPEGAEWAAPARIINGVVYRADGAGYLPQGYTQIFTLPADGGAPRQRTFAARNHDGRLSWTPGGQALIFSANAEENWEYDPIETEIYSLDLESGAIARLTTRDGPDDSPTLSPNGRRLAFVGFDDEVTGYQVTNLYVADASGANPRQLAIDLDRDVHDPQWAGNNTLYFMYDDHGRTHLARVDVGSGRVTRVMSGIGGADLGRPYTGGAFSVNASGRYAATITAPTNPSDVVVGSGANPRQVTQLNEDLLAGKIVPDARLLTARSSVDGREIEAWVVRPPDFDPARRYPMVLEIHGGPWTAYGPVFSAEIQLFASAGYIVVYANPRGSTSYGQEFGGLINNNYPSQDYDDLMSVVDAAIASEPIDPEKLYVTGGSGGGVLTAWIVGSTDRFAGAVVQKPVINWTSFALTADFYTLFGRYWFNALPWEEGAQERYWARSPLSRVGNVTTPTAVLVGEEDYRTPVSESEQFYQALRLRQIPTRLITIPGSPHDIAQRPSGLIAKVINSVQWFSEHGGPAMPPATPAE